MTTIQCKVEEKGVRCSTTIEVNEPVSDDVSFTCRNHPRAVQARANQRIYDPTHDEADQQVHFQDVQFDPDLRRSSKPIGTSHIEHQGNAKRTDLIFGKMNE
jgi:hypothetical protein